LLAKVSRIYGESRTTYGSLRVHAQLIREGERAGGTMIDVTVPSIRRWIAKGMTVKYLAKSETNCSTRCNA